MGPQENLPQGVDFGVVLTADLVPQNQHIPLPPGSIVRGTFAGWATDGQRVQIHLSNPDVDSDGTTVDLPISAGPLMRRIPEGLVHGAQIALLRAPWDDGREWILATISAAPQTQDDLARAVALDAETMWGEAADTDIRRATFQRLAFHHLAALESMTPCRSSAWHETMGSMAILVNHQPVYAQTIATFERSHLMDLQAWAADLAEVAMEQEHDRVATAMRDVPADQPSEVPGFAPGM
ncbi:MAG: hypothetical protein HKL99_14100 [Burkholderiales bacterium]|nr:hypothetical protein [Burkholderiales bacterium]